MPIRAFVAVPVRPSQRLDLLLNDLRPLRSGRAVKPTLAENLHVTLRFLGDVEPAQVDAVTDAMRTATAGIDAFELTLENVGAFPSVGRPSVVWIGATDQGQLATIAEKLNGALADVGFVSEDRPWHGHVTIARIKARPPARLRQFISDHENDRFADMRVSSIQLMRSDLQANGPVYSSLASAPLTGA